MSKIDVDEMIESVRAQRDVRGTAQEGPSRSAELVHGLVVPHLVVEVGTALYPAVPASPPMWAVCAVIGVSFGTGTLFGVLPAWRAARLDPVSALQGGH